MTQKNSRIAIIGAGVSGIFTALELKKRGYTHITLFEKNERITSLTSTLAYDNHQFDLSTKLIPAVGLTHDGVFPPLLELVQATGVTLQGTPMPTFYNFTHHKRMAIPRPMHQYSKLKIIRDFAKAHSLLAQLSAYSSLAEIYRTDLVRAEESIAAWAARHRVEAFGQFTDYLVDLFSMGPAHLVPAGFVLVSRVHFVAPYLLDILSRKGVKHFYKLFGSKQNPGLRKFLKFRKKSTNYFVVKEGYEEFFRRLVLRYELNVACKSAVSNLRRDAGELRFTVNGVQEVACDKLIFCCPPPAIAGLSYLPEAKRLAADVVPARTVRSWAFKVQGWNTRDFGTSGYVIDGTNELGLGTEAMKINGELMYVSKETAQSDLLISPVYLDDATSEAARLAALQTSLVRFNMDLKEVVTYQDFTWPHFSSLALNQAGWNEAFERLQGQDNIFYSGECFSGIGVPTILEFSSKFADKYF